jgi:hypothetical protein
MVRLLRYIHNCLYSTNSTAQGHVYSGLLFAEEELEAEEREWVVEEAAERERVQEAEREWASQDALC